MLAVLAAIVTMLLWGPLLLGLAFGVADTPGEEHTLWIIMFWWVLIGWPIASAAAVACAVLVGRWPRLAAWLLVAVAVAMGFPTVLNGLVALAAAAFAYLYSRTAEPPALEEPTAPKFLRAAAIGVGAVVLILGAAMTVPSVYEWVRADDSGGEQPSEEPAARPFTTPEDALRDYAEAWAPPFLGDCPGLGESGSCVETSQVFQDVASYRLCTMDTDQCVTVHIARKEAAWAVAEVEEETPIPKP